MNDIDLKSGEIIFDEFHIDFSKPLSEQLDCLSEDLIQIKYAGGYLIDVGWYPEYEEKGNFIVQVIKNQNWETTILKKECRLKSALADSIVHAIKVAESGSE